ncbi:hypothetical protein [Tabrizicola soli]|uniref:hypothetical protein n=1 Tax=Tabrizicola soli TaxID=2185115 RepID=UPI0018D33DB0|nr:hypothetical protein [Tabrizicola soli]
MGVVSLPPTLFQTAEPQRSIDQFPSQLLRQVLQAMEAQNEDRLSDMDLRILVEAASCASVGRFREGFKTVGVASCYDQVIS